MRTNNYIDNLTSIVDSEFVGYTTSNYDFFSYEINGKPNHNLIFLQYANFDVVVEEFFDNLFNYIVNSGQYNNIKIFLLFKLCVIELFKKTSLSSGNLSKKMKDKYKVIKDIDEVEFDTLVLEIKNIKMHYKNKYTFI